MRQGSIADSYVALVTDDPTFRYIVGSALERAGIPVLACGDERTALEAVSAANPAALLLEVSLGGDSSGVGLVKALRRDRALAGIPIVVCSADERFLELHLLELVHLGCDVLGLPYNFALILATLDQAIQRAPLLVPSRVQNAHALHRARSRAPYEVQTFL